MGGQLISVVEAVMDDGCDAGDDDDGRVSDGGGCSSGDGRYGDNGDGGGVTMWRM